VFIRSVLRTCGRRYPHGLTMHTILERVTRVTPKRTCGRNISCPWADRRSGLLRAGAAGVGARIPTSGARGQVARHG
jgi:hypothetical protein